jgi:hypothetical protein
MIKQLSFLLPTRERPELVKRLVQSIVDTASHLEDIEIVLCVDDDDLASQDIEEDQLYIQKVTVSKGSTMGSLNRACFNASSGRYVILMNDDVVIRTKDWDQMVSSALSQYTDDIALIHVDDLLFRDKLCTFPILSRRACLEIGICPAEYKKYRIDDHIYDTYNILAYLGHRRILYLSGVIFEHDYNAHIRNHRNSQISKYNQMEIPISNKDIIESDLSTFNKKLNERKQDALKLIRVIDAEEYDKRKSTYLERLNSIKDPYSYRRDDFIKRISSCQYKSFDHSRGRCITKNDDEEGKGRLVSGLDLGSTQYPIGRMLLIKLVALTKSNRYARGCVSSISSRIAEAFNRYYFRLPGFIRRVADGLVFKLVNIYRTIQYSSLSSPKE